jgi:hypothetical protein
VPRRGLIRGEQRLSAKRLRRLHADRLPAVRPQVRTLEQRRLHAPGHGAAVLAGDVNDVGEERARSQRASRVVNRDHVHRAAAKLLTEGAQRVPLRGVPGGTSQHQPHVATVAVLAHHLRRPLLILGPYDQQHRSDARFGADCGQRPAQQRATGQRGKDLVRRQAGADAAAGREEDEGRDRRLRRRPRRGHIRRHRALMTPG